MNTIRLKPLARFTITVLIVAFILGITYVTLNYLGFIGKTNTAGTTVLGRIDLPTAPKNAISSAPFLPLPDKTQYTSGFPIRHLHWAWNANLGLFYSNGGKTTTSSSIMASKKLSVTFTRQDDVPQMQTELVKFATAYKNGDPNPKEGVHFVTIMGDGASMFLSGVNSQLEKLGKEYQAKIIASIGKSYGEDKFMGLPAWRSNPQSAKGACIATYLRDGDMNIVLKWCSDNDNIPVNPDETTYDPNAVNFISAESYIDAAQKYITKFTETRPEIIDGKLTGKKVQITCNGVATWTPGDVMVAKERGGLVSIASTKEYSTQMHCTIIGISKWMKENENHVIDYIDAALKGSDQVKSYSVCLKRATEIAVECFGGKEDAEYWLKYYHGTTEPDAQGLMVELGGSGVCNLGDNMELFGLSEGSTNIYSKVYTTFGEVNKLLYPNIIPDYPSAEDAVDLSYLRKLIAKIDPKNISAPEEIQYNPGKIVQPVSSKNWNIQFETGKAEFTQAALNDLQKLLNDLLIANNLKVEIHGHTDNIGSDEVNQVLSQQRADAVAAWLRKKAPNDFPSNRIITYAHGSQNPVADNSTYSGQAKNRRVTITLGK